MNPAEKYLTFEDLAPGKGMKTKVILVKSARSGIRLGVISWFGQWRQYTFQPYDGTIWNPDCLKVVSDHCEAETRLHRAKLRENAVTARKQVMP